MTAQTSVPDEELRPEGMRALHAERVDNLRLRRELRETRVLLHNLRAAVISATNHLVDVAEQAGAQRTENTNV